tara:strand:+ start:83 stop:400 length:318 start_codon:yes stop_codon:yes gene_type:complete
MDFTLLPNDILINILGMRKDIKQKEREAREEEEKKTKYYKGKFSRVLLHLEAYAEEWDDINGVLGNGGDIRCDLAFIDYNDLWDSSEYVTIVDKQGPDFDPNDYY